jgi:hypothetical protein
LPSTLPYLNRIEGRALPVMSPATPSGPLPGSTIVISRADFRSLVNEILLLYGNDYRNSIPQIYTAP